jgi:glc operon protein GlcG
MLSHLNARAYRPLPSRAAFSVSAALLASLLTRPILTVEAAHAIASTAEAGVGGWPRVVAVVGSKGLPIVLERMDDATVLADVEFAPGNARAAALFRRESGALKGAVNGNRRAAITARSFVPMRGDIPLVIGAIGVSADTSDHNEQVARAGVAALVQ